MGWFDRKGEKEVSRGQGRIDEQMDAFKPKKERAASKKAKAGEGLEDMDFILQGNYNALGFNSFYRTYINKTFQNELERLKYYREMSQYPEIADVIEDATMESTQEDYEGRMIKMEIIDEDLAENKNIVNNLQNEFNDLFYKNICNFVFFWISTTFFNFSFFF